MAIPRKSGFPDKDVTIAEVARALSHPARLAILRLLAQNGESLCGDIVACLPLAQSTVSQHLKALRSVGLIKGKVDGPRSLYKINWSVVKGFNALSKGFFSGLFPHERANERVTIAAR